MKKKLLLTTAVAAAVCFNGTAKADDPVAGSEINAAATVTRGVSGFTRDETNSDAGARYWGVYGLSGAADLTINAGLTFSGNKNTVSGGAILNALTGVNREDGQDVTVTIGNNVTFSGNESKRGGAFYSEGAEIAGAHNFDYGTQMTVGDKVAFTGNKAASYGGAIALNGKNTATFGDDVTFSGNTASGASEYLGGGAIWAYTYYNTFAAGDYAGDITVDFGKRATFTGNTAQTDGGAIELLIENWDETGTQPVYPNPVNTMTFDDGAVFKNNTAVTGRGGAIANFGGTLTFGDVTFSGNKAGGVLNDIYNEGTVNFNGDTTLDGGITGTGTVVFAAGTTLSAKLQTTVIEADTVTFAGDNKVKLTVANGLADNEYDFITATTPIATVENVTIDENALYNLELTEAGKISVSVKSAKEMIDAIDAPVSAQEAETLAAVISTNGKGTDIANDITDRISSAIQNGDTSAAVQAIQELAPTTSQQVMGVAQGVNNMLSNVTGGRMAAVSGRAGGDAFTGGALWVQTLYNHTRQNTTSAGAGFNADSTGVAMGIDGKANDALTIGFGYGYTATDAKSAGRKVDVDGHNFFVYGSYQPSAWYIDAMVSYGIGQYTEKKAPMGVAMKAKYHVNTFAANLMSGYGFDSGFTPEGGLRYVAAFQETYNDGAQNISTDNNDVLTAVMGVKFEKGMQAGDWNIKPNMRLAATYDLISDNSMANIDIIGGGNYQIVGKRLKRLGAEAGAGLTGTIGKWDLSLEYNGGFRRDYQSHTGLIKAQYNF